MQRTLTRMRSTLLLILCAIAPFVHAQSSIKSLQHWLNGVARYDNEYPREVVYLHTDQQAYVHGERLWIKAYVMRASTLRPTPVSRVLYTELLNSKGQVMERQLLRIDEQGQAEGHMDLEDPIHCGFYELRAYTREMVNWGSDAVFSQIIPVFDEHLEIDTPDEADRPAPTNSLKKEQSPTITFGESVDSMQLCALLITNRERPCYVDTLTVGGAAGAVQIEIDESSLRDGWNRLNLMTAQGTSLQEEWLWKEPQTQRRLNVNIRQSEAKYAPFAPIAVEVEVRDAEGKPLRDVQFSMAVHDKEGDILTEHPIGMDTLLLSDHAGQAQDFATMTGAQPFHLYQPIEDKLLLRGQVFRDNDKRRPMPHSNLHIRMYAPSGSNLSGDTRTDADGRFAFTSNEDFTGDWIAQLTVNNDEGKHKWSRVTLGRWFYPEKHNESLFWRKALPLREAIARSLTKRETEGAKKQDVTADATPALFHWEDTIPRIPKAIALSEAKVTGKGKYRGLRGNRYSYRGGERRGMHFADKYINIIQALEQWKDAGGGTNLIQYFLPEYDPDFRSHTASHEGEANTYDETSNIQVQDTDPFDKTYDSSEIGDGMRFFYKGREAITFFDNQLLGTDLAMANISETYWAEEIKSVVVMEHLNQYERFMNFEEIVALHGSAEKPAIFIYTRPEAYRFKGKKGLERRIIQGFQQPMPYPAPNYNGLEAENPDDYRRTLYWAPRLTTNDEGKASVVFFNGARPDTKLSFSLRGITPDGHIINVDK